MLTASTNGLALDGGLDGPETVGLVEEGRLGLRLAAVRSGRAKRGACAGS
jgi:hypothetical protein